jgi:hypothetical protein
MLNTLKNILALIVGVVSGSALNMALVVAGGKLIPPPAGGDVTTMEGLAETMHLFGPEHFLFPFLAHALGTLVGAFAAAKLAPGRKMLLAVIVGFFFLAGGIANVFMLPSPIWFTALDLIAAYLPMALIGGRLAGASFTP